MSRDDAKAYLAWLARKAGKRYRLLSEVEREYVTRAGTSTAFGWGASSRRPRRTNIVMFLGCATKKAGTVPADSYRPSPWGLYQVHGSVWEWVEESFGEMNS
ncbi:MAG: formylglycine-generating enzyme family protein [Xanthobacteraceae bacterium]